MGAAFDPERLLRRPLVAILSTVAADGAPRTAPVWYLWEEGALFMLSNVAASSARRIAGDRRCAVEIVDYCNEAGRLAHLGLRGRAEVLPSDPPRFRRLLTRYLGPPDDWNPWFIENIARVDDDDGRMIRLVPESAFTNNVSYFRTGPNLAWPNLARPNIARPNIAGPDTPGD